MSSAINNGTVPSERFAKFQTSFYTSPEDAYWNRILDILLLLEKL